jgi:hypothetical protein
MTTTITRLQAIDLAVEAEACGVDVLELASVSGITSTRVIVLASELHAVLHELHRELHRIAAASGFTPDQVEVVFDQLLASWRRSPRPQRPS